MKTEDLIGLLAADTAPVPRHAGEQRLALADHFAEGVVREAAFRRRLERLRGRRCRVDGSDQQAGDGQGKDRRHVHGWPPA